MAGWIGDDVLNHHGFDAALEEGLLEGGSPGGEFGSAGDVDQFVQESAQIVVVVLVRGDGDGVGAVLIGYEGVAGLQFLDFQLH